MTFMDLAARREMVKGGTAPPCFLGVSLFLIRFFSLFYLCFSILCVLSVVFEYYKRRGRAEQEEEKTYTIPVANQRALALQDEEIVLELPGSGAVVDNLDAFAVGSQGFDLVDEG